MGKEAFLLETSRIHSSMVCQRAAIELFRDSPVFEGDETFSALAAEGGNHQNRLLFVYKPASRLYDSQARSWTPRMIQAAPRAARGL